LQNSARDYSRKGETEFKQVYKKDHKTPASITFHPNARSKFRAFGKDEKMNG
jgi:hypothetical protein